MKIYEQNIIRRKDLQKASDIVVPNPHYLDNIEIIYTILGLIWKDWEVITKRYREEISNKTDIEISTIFIKYYASNQEIYLKCLFSYVYFFWTLINVYDKVYADLNKFNRNYNLKVKHLRKPHADIFIQKTRNIRDLSITHIGSDRVDLIDSLAAYSWRPLTASYKISEIPDLEHIEFGGGKLSRIDKSGKKIDQTKDFYVKGLLELKERCDSYLESYDNACIQYLSDLQRELTDE